MTPRAVARLLIAALAALPATVAGQQIPLSPISPAECAAEVQALADGARDGTGWGRLAACGPTGGEALARALRAARSESDRDYLGQLFSVGGGIQDPTLFGTALKLAKDDDAGTPVRLVALLLGLAQIEPSLTFRLDRPWDALFDTPLEPSCRWHVVQEGDDFQSSTPLPADAAQQLAAVSAHVGRTAGDPVLGALAVCVRSALADRVPTLVKPSQIRLKYLCGNDFLVRNKGSEWIDVTWDVDGTADHGALGVPARGQVEFTTEVTGTTRLFFQGVLIETEANRGKPCSP